MRAFILRGAGRSYSLRHSGNRRCCWLLSPIWPSVRASLCSPRPGPDPGLVLPAGELIALPGAEATTRGFAAVTWLIVDEAARVADSLWFSAQAYLATTGGRITLLSTPFGRRGFFHYEATRAKRWDVTRVTAYDCPRISAAFLDEQQATLPAAWFRQEYLCEFTATEDTLFLPGMIAGVMSSSEEPLLL